MPYDFLCILLQGGNKTAFNFYNITGIKFFQNWRKYISVNLDIYICENKAKKIYKKERKALKGEN